MQDLQNVFSARRQGNPNVAPASSARGSAHLPVASDSQPEGQPSPAPDDGGAAASEQAEPPASLTGAESPDELNAQGFSQNAQDRIRELGRQKNEAESKYAQLEQRFEQLLGTLEGRQGQGQAEAAPEPQEIPIPEFAEPRPDPDDYEAMQKWEMRKMIHDEANRIVRNEFSQFVPQLGQAFGPVVEDFARRQREQEWSKIEPTLKGMGVAREEIEDEVNAIIQAQPQLGVAAAAYNAIAYKEIPVHERVRKAAIPEGSTPPQAVSNPGSGRRPQQQGQGQQTDPMAQLQQLATEAQGQGELGLAKLFGGMRQLGGIRTQKPLGEY